MPFKINTSEKAIHLTRKRLWEECIRFERLVPTSPLLECLEKDKRFYRKCTFAILEREIPKWKNNPHFRDLWKRLLDHIAGFGRDDVVTLSFEILPKDKVDVLDRIPVTRCYDYKVPADEEAYREYMASCIPFRDYDGNYELPELAIYTPIEARRLKVTKGVVEYNINDRIKNSFFALLDVLREDTTRKQAAEPVSPGTHWKERFS